MKTGKFLVTRLGMFPDTTLTDTIEHVRVFVKGYGSHEYRVFRVNKDGYIQRCNLTGRVL